MKVQPKSLALEQKRKAWELHMQYKTHQEIADALKMNLPAVHKMLGRMNRAFKDSLAADIEKEKLDQIARHRNIAREAHEAWERSKQNSKAVRQKKGTVNGQPHPVIEQIIDAREQYGDPRYLEVEMKSLEAIRKITGADSPIKIQHSGDKNADAIKLEYSATKAGFLAELAILTGQVQADGVHRETE
jgi:hypothetical protein